MSKLIPLTTLILLICSCGGTKETGETGDTEPVVAENFNFEEVLHLDWIGVEHGLISSTNISHDLKTLREVAWGVKFISDTFKSWGRDYVQDNQEGGLPNCISLTGDNGANSEKEWEVSIPGCNIGANNSTPIVGSGTLNITQNQIGITLDLTTTSSNAEIDWDLTILWEDITDPSISPEAVFSLSAIYSGNQSGRMLTIDESVAILTDRIEELPDFAIPNSSLSEVGAVTSWTDRSDSIAWGANLDEDDRLYSGDFIYEYSDDSGVVASISSGNIVETESSLAIVSTEFGATEQSKFNLQEFTVDWNLDNNSFNGEIAFSFEDEVLLFKPSWSANVTVAGFTSTPVQISGDANALTAVGSLEISYSYTNNLLEEVTSWVSVFTSDMTFANSNNLASDGSISAQNVQNTEIDLFFQSEPSSFPWVLISVGGGEDWVCKDLDTTEEVLLDSEPNDHAAACP